jgi:hypothetical protein
MRRLKTKAARDQGLSSPTSPLSRPGAKLPSSEPSVSRSTVSSDACSVEELTSQISSCPPARIPQFLDILKQRRICAIENAALCACLTERFWHCLEHGHSSVGAAIIVESQLWESAMTLACVDVVDARSPERARIVEIFSASPDIPIHLLSDVLDKVSPDCAIKLIRKRHIDFRSFPSLYQFAVFKELAWICSQFPFNQVFGTLLISAIACYPDLPVLAFVKERLPHFFDASKKSFLENPSALLLPSLSPPVKTPTDSYSVPSHVNMRLVSDALGLLECIEMIRANSTIGIDMEWSGTGVLSHPSGQAPADVIQIGNSPSALFCSVFLLDTRAIRHEVHLVQTLFCELFSSAHTVLVCDFSADRLALSAAFPEVKLPNMAAPQLLDLSLTCGKVKKSLSSLAKDFCQLSLSKSWQICGWNFRPWLPSQVEYATSDVLVMHMIHEQQQGAAHLQPS